ncbi:MAG: spermidine/putrescine ABC transporter substrate-binding protein [Oscillospiraceae bacterium]
MGGRYFLRLQKFICLTISFVLLCVLLTAYAGTLPSGIPASAEETESEADEGYELGNTLTEDMLSDYDYSRLKDADITLNVANWGEYMSVNDDEYIDVNKAFEELTGIKVNYTLYASNEELYAKIKSSGANYDVVIPSDYMIARMIEEGLLQKLDFNNIPNYSYIGDAYKGLEYDPTNEYTVPYLWGIVCIVYNTKKVNGEITGWKDLWNEAYSSEILMFNNPRDAFGIALKYLGYSLNTEDTGELAQAASLLKKQKPLVQAYVMDEIFDKMGSGSAAIAPYYAGDVITMMDDNPDLSYCIPEDGTNRFVDACAIPVNAENKEAAEMYINFLNETEIAFTNTEYVGYSTPHTGAYALLSDEEKENPLRCPDEQYLADHTEVFLNLSEDTNNELQKLWISLKIEHSRASWFVPVCLLFAVAATVLINVRRARRKKQDIF